MDEPAAVNAAGVPTLPPQFMRTIPCGTSIVLDRTHTVELRRADTSDTW